MQGGHALLANRIKTRQRRLSASDGVVVQVRDQPIRRLPGFSVGFTDDHVQTNAEAYGAAELGGFGANLGDLLGHRCWRLAPGQDHFHLFSSQVLRRFRRTTEVQRRTRLLNRRVEQLGAFHADVLTVVIDGFAFQHTTPDAGEFHRGLIAFFVAEEQTVASQFFRVTASHQIEQRTAAGQTIQRGCLPRRHRRGNDPGAQGNEELQTLGHRDQRRRHQPRIFARAAGGDQHTAEAQTIRRLRDLLQITVVDGASAFGGAKVMAVAVGRQEPEDIEAHGVVSLGIRITAL
ncbi:hypothetical protein PS681_04063 [Pseudomonas fluorescens]|nr:hypothetical protein PS681_04063 [Pseudomonas fluorescens]